LRGVGGFLARAPGMPNLSFNDGTPFADPATKQWIDAEVKPVMGGGGGGGGPAVSPLEAKIDQAKSLAANGALPDAVQLLLKAPGEVRMPVDRFRGKLAVAQVCLQAEQVLIARSALDGLDRLVEQHRLWEWDPELCSQFYQALYAAHRGMNVATGMETLPEARARELAIFERLCQLDARAALKFTLGV
jgi:type VI secretion system protein VasJ